jgi:cytidine deaminase
VKLDNSKFNDLFIKASEVMEAAYVPYSKFKVGAAILDENDNYHVGCNVENAAYPVGNCAEASAISSMIVSKGTKIIAIAVTGYGDMLCTPCGGCRQRIREFASLNTPIIIGNEKKIQKIFTLKELLPYSFGPENLNN